MEHYLTVNELSEKIKLAPGTIRNMICKGAFKKNIHYVKPTARRVLFVWSAVEDWLLGDAAINKRTGQRPSRKKINRINI